MDEGDIIDGRYKVQKKLGQGGMGQVFCGLDIELNKTVAIKVLFPNTADQVIKRFHIEARTLGKFNHPNIMAVSHFGQASNGQLYLINEFVKGDSLSDLIEKRGPQTFFDILPIFERICRGLRYAHMEKVLHRDIKPSNVMLAFDRSQEGGGVKLVDFGLAKPNDQDHHLTKTGAAMGSPPYMSPESVHGKDTDQRSDIYSLGCTLFEMMAAVPPFVGETPFHTMMAQISRMPPTLEEACGKPFDAEVETFVQKFIKKNPDDRFQNMDEVIAELERVTNFLIERKSASEGIAPSNVYDSTAWIANKTARTNSTLRRVSALVGIVGLVIGLVFGYFYSNETAPKASVEGDLSQKTIPKKANTTTNEEKTGNAMFGVRAYDTGATIMKDTDYYDKVCLLSGKLDDDAVHAIMKEHGKLKCFQFQDLTISESSMRYILGFPIQKIIFTSTKVTGDMLKMVGEMKELIHLRITNCGALPQGCLDGLKPLKRLKTFMTVDLECGKDYKHPAAALAGMPKLVWLKFRNCKITREDMKTLAALKNMRRIQFKACEIASDAIPELKAAPLCNDISITECRDLPPRQFQQIADLHFIETLYLYDTNIDNSALAGFKKLKKLTLIDVKNSRVNEEGMKELMLAIPALQPKKAVFGLKTHDD